jgi:fructan beta-fructosidase
MAFPCDLTLRSFPEGLRICRLPAAEIKNLYEKQHVWKDVTIKPGENPLKDVSGELFDIQLQAEVGGATKFGIKWRGGAVTYSAEKETLNCLGREAKVQAANGQITLRILIDRTSIEVFANDGKVSMSSCYLPKPNNLGVEFFSDGGDLKITSMTVCELTSAWPESQRKN